MADCLEALDPDPERVHEALDQVDVRMDVPSLRQQRHDIDSPGSAPAAQDAVDKLIVGHQSISVVQVLEQHVHVMHVQLQQFQPRLRRRRVQHDLKLIPIHTARPICVGNGEDGFQSADVFVLFPHALDDGNFAIARCSGQGLLQKHRRNDPHHCEGDKPIIRNEEQGVQGVNLKDQHSAGICPCTWGQRHLVHGEQRVTPTPEKGVGRRSRLQRRARVQDEGLDHLRDENSRDELHQHHEDDRPNQRRYGC
mmetsp:Transcript_39378/g.112903  ORF Transcript_39378/g.112903 Transcript_39378/m.112903 type:complete len:252 (-) Transcript_39378:1112-1867(-)